MEIKSCINAKGKDIEIQFKSNEYRTGRGRAYGLLINEFKIQFNVNIRAVTHRGALCSLSDILLTSSRDGSGFTDALVTGALVV